MKLICQLSCSQSDFCCNLLGIILIHHPTYSHLTPGCSHNISKSKPPCFGSSGWRGSASCTNFRTAGGETEAETETDRERERERGEFVIVRPDIWTG